MTQATEDIMQAEEIEQADAEREKYERAEEVERLAHHEASVEAFCTSGNGHDFEITEGEYVGGRCTTTGIGVQIVPALMVCHICGNEVEA